MNNDMNLDVVCLVKLTNMEGAMRTGEFECAVILCHQICLPRHLKFMTLTVCFIPFFISFLHSFSVLAQKTCGWPSTSAVCVHDQWSP